MTRDPQSLSDYILGDGGVFGYAGLLDRVRDRVKALDADAGPGFVTGSIIGGGDNVYPDDSESEQAILDLATLLLEWKGDNQAAEKTKRSLIAYLKKYRISDTDLILGSKKVGHGLLERTRDRVRGLLHVEVPSGKSLGACYALVELLLEWIDRVCDHEYIHDPQFEVATCSICGLIVTGPLPAGRTR